MTLPDPATRMTPDWISRAMAACPWMALPNGEFRTSPFRASFPSVFRPSKNKEDGDDKEPKYSIAMVFPVGTDFTIPQKAVYDLALSEFPFAFQNGQFVGGIRLPFRNQADKAMKLKGYMPGGVFFNASSKHKPAVVHQSNPNSPLLDESKVYPGVWCIGKVNPFAYKNKAKGVSWGFKSLMVIADDENIGGVGPGDPAKDFAGVNIETSTNFDPGNMFAGGGGGAAVDPMKALFG